MAIPEDFFDAMNQISIACENYKSRSGYDAVLVGGAATVIFTDGAFSSGDFDFVAVNDEVFEKSMLDAGFIKENRKGKLIIGYYHPDHPRYGFQCVSGSLFDGKADRKRLFALKLRNDLTIKLPSIEDMIADRLAQYAVASPTDDSRLRQAKMLFFVAPTIDKEYVCRRIEEEGGDPSLLGL